MPLKTWILDAVNKMHSMMARDDLPPRAQNAGAAWPPSRASRNDQPAAAAFDDEFLGPYAPLITAIRQELEQFVQLQVRLHLAIAEHDRYILTSIDLSCPDGGEALQLLRRFMREFKPEQIKRYLMRQVIPGLPNASAIDLAQFRGLTVLANETPEGNDPGQEEEYGELLQALRSDLGRAPGQGAYQVAIQGRWAHAEPPAGSAQPGPAPPTPLAAGPALELALEDAAGQRQVALPPAAPGRRYVVGKGDGSDVRVDGIYASRRHCEIWLEQGAWWVLDTGSTNGIRVEQDGRVLGRSSPAAGAASGARQEAIRLPPGATLVLSALAQGTGSEYPRLTLPAPTQDAALMTPIAPGAGMSNAPRTPITPIVGGRAKPAGELDWIVSAQMADGARTVRIDPAQLPFSIGRSRNQALVIAAAHESVSGHHLDITGLDEAGAALLVHGDNGVVIEGGKHRAGASCRWRAGETMVLAPALAGEPVCTLTLRLGA